MARESAGKESKLSEELPASPEPLDTYAIIEAMGHRTLIGAVTEATIAGKQLLKVDRLDGVTQYLPPESLYMLTPCTQDQAREAARRQYGSGLPHYLAALTSGSTSPWADEDSPGDRGYFHGGNGESDDLDDSDLDDNGDDGA